MIKYAVVFLFSVCALQAQDNANTIPSDLEVGAIFEIGRPETNTFEHIDFPSADYIVKKGGNANLRSVEGTEVMVTSLKKKSNGITQVKVATMDGSRFFGIQKQVTVDFDEAIKSGELQAK